MRDEMQTPVMIHRETSPETIERFKALLAAIIGAGDGPLAVVPCQYHGQASTMLCQSVRGPGGMVGLAPLAVLLDPARDAEALRGPDGEPAMLLGPGGSVSPLAPRARQAHDGVPLSTGQYL